MEETDEPCAKLCGNCVHFNVLDDLRAGDPCKWFGACQIEFQRDHECENWTGTVLDWIYYNGRHGDDDCERPDEWFEEG